MSISIDVSQLEIVKTFSGFLQIMQEPDKYKDLLKETDRLIAEQKKLLGPVQTKEQADKYLADAQLKIDEWATADQKKQDDFAAVVELKEKALIELEAKAQETLKAAREKEDKASKTLVEVDELKAEAQTYMNKEAAKLKETEDLLASNLSKQQELDLKMEKINKMLGE